MKPLGLLCSLWYLRFLWAMIAHLRLGYGQQATSLRVQIGDRSLVGVIVTARHSKKALRSSSRIDLTSLQSYVAIDSGFASQALSFFSKRACKPFLSVTSP